MNKTILASGIFLGLLAVLLGAFGAHGLRDLISDSELEAFETGVDYQMYHALLLMILGNLNMVSESRKRWIFHFFMAGIICFSFSLYLLALDGLWELDLDTLGFLTPLGGILLIIGWILLAYRVFKPLNKSIN
jgi:uncharacterized membrane protein YgdD (TMEM256/DUF423 family)